MLIVLCRFFDSEINLSLCVLLLIWLPSSVENTQQKHKLTHVIVKMQKCCVLLRCHSDQEACYTGITPDAGADSFIPTVCFAD